MERLTKPLTEYTRDEFLAMDNFMPKGTFRDIIIVPTGEIHDSGFMCMKFILAKRGEIVGVVSGWSDVVHINGIGGYGNNVMAPFGGVKQKTKVVGWSIDCMPGSGCVRLFSDKDCVIEGTFVGSDFVFYVEEQE